jgi:Tripartite tricarboxylate transporter family receptor
VIKSPPDGYTLFMVGPNNAINASLYDKLNFDFVRDFAPDPRRAGGKGAICRPGRGSGVLLAAKVRRARSSRCR